MPKVDYCKKQLELISWVSGAHTCNPSYSGGRDQEDHSLKPAQENSVQKKPILKKPITKKGWCNDSRCRP
jgi:hypothetical protein